MTAFVGLFGLALVAWFALSIVRGLFRWIFVPRPMVPMGGWFWRRPLWGGMYRRGPMMHRGMYGRRPMGLGPGGPGMPGGPGRPGGPMRGGMRF